eukprot:218061_1
MDEISSPAFVNPFKKRGGKSEIVNDFDSAGDNDRVVRSFGDHPFVDNQIRNTKYTLVNFVPKNLLLQVRHNVNLYFLLIACLQLIPQITPVRPASTWVPLGVIFGLTMVKEAIDDYHRYKQDCEVNNRKFLVVRHGNLVEIRSMDIKVGDILVVPNNEEVPCDIVLLQTSQADGSCYIETANIDGETNLKSRSALPQTHNLDEMGLRGLDASIECPLPNKHIYSFDACLSLTTDDQVVSLSVSFEQLLPQGTVLRNTESVRGLVVYTGRDTKLGMNKKEVPDKWTVVDKKVDRMTVVLFSAMFVTVFAFGICGNIWKSTVGYKEKSWYLNYSKSSKPWMFLVIPLRFLLLCSMMIPISLKVSLDLTKLYHAYLIRWDRNMYDPISNTPAHAANTAISEDLGQLDYVLTDKTGTLTENRMIFKCCCIGSVSYGLDQSIFQDTDLHSKLQFDTQTILFFKALSLCNTVVPDTELGSGIDDAVVGYSAASPDEKALVEAAARLGVIMQVRNNDTVELRVFLKRERYDILHVIPFDSDRKRMSIILRERESNRIVLFCKGADQVIIARLSEEDKSRIATRSTILSAETYAREGLRTLFIAFREIDPHELDEWSAAVGRARIAVRNRQQKLEAAYNLIEHSFKLLGVSGIEDSLQDEVPETIHIMRRAGIRFWMLTGDHMHTAVEIGRSCRMVAANANVSVIDGKTPVELKDCLERIYASMQQQMRLFGGNYSKGSLSSTDRVTMISGSNIAIVLERFPELFAEMAVLCETVICFRVTPSQKAAVVCMLKNRGLVTLAIGDGGNDVGMIQKAQIGVGLTGHEGMEASRASDYSFARFKYLSRLCLVHGHYANMRISFITQYCFYKSLFICLIQLSFAFFSGFSGASLFDSIALMTYNILFTSLAPMLYIVEKDFSETRLIKQPDIYRWSQSGGYFSLRTAVMWELRAVAQAVIVALVVFSTAPYGYSLGGRIRDETATFAACVLIQVFTMALETQYFTIPNHIAIWGTAIFFFVFNLIIGAIPSKFPYFTNALSHIQLTLLGQTLFWLVVIIILVSTLSGIVCVKYWTFWYSPTPMQRARHVTFAKNEEDDDKAILLCNFDEVDDEDSV